MEKIAPILNDGLCKCTRLHSFQLLISMRTFHRFKHTHGFERRMTTESFLAGIKLASFLSKTTSHLDLRIVAWERDVRGELVCFPSGVWETLRHECGKIGLKTIVVQFDSFNGGLHSVQQRLQEIPELEDAARLGGEGLLSCGYAQCSHLKGWPPLKECSWAQYVQD